MYDPLMAITRLLRPSVVIELGPCDGRYSIQISEYCEKLYCIEGRKENVAETRQSIQSHLKRVADVSVVHSEIQRYLNTDAQALLRIDLVWARGVLYHFENPCEVIQSLGSLREKHHFPVIGWTHLAEHGDEQHEGRAGRWYEEDPEGSRLSSIGNQRSFWLTPEAFMETFKAAGFANFAYISEPTPHETNGGLVAYFVAGE